MNCNLVDVHNLAYIIARVQRGVPRLCILSTDSVERRGLADAYSKQSAKEGQQISTPLQNL